MCSFDVISLFTSIPVERTIDHILSIIDESCLPVQNCLRELLLMACKNILFSFNQKLFRQIDGMSMGSSLGPTMADFTMDMIESKFSEFSGPRPLFYKRFVDDCFLIFQDIQQASDFFEYVNSLNSDIKFTMEVESNRTIEFLDTKIEKTDSALNISWKLKETNTGIYIPNVAHAPRNYKTAAMRALFFRAKRISSNDNLYSQACKTITEIFIGNGYSRKLIDSVKQEAEQSVERRTVGIGQENPSTTCKYLYWKFPFIEDKYKSLKASIKNLNSKIPEDIKIRPVFRTFKTSMFFRNKDVISPDLKSKCVYAYTCGQCKVVYLGETSRHLITRINEHIDGYPNPTEVSLHPHKATRDNFKIVGSSEHHKILESIMIREHTDLLNLRDASVPLLLKL